MGTNNFASPSNTKNYYVVLTNREVEVKTCPECGEVHHEWEYSLNNLRECTNCETDLTEVETETEWVAPDDFEYEDLKSNILHEIKAIGGYDSNMSFNDRNYERVALGELSKSKVYADVEVEVKITAIIQSAYYEGATLDYLIQVCIEGDDWNYSTGSSYDEDNLEGILDEIGEIQSYRGLNEGMVSIIRPKVESFLETTIDTLSEQMDNLLKQYSEHKLNKVGQFSNGEAVYETA